MNQISSLTEKRPSITEKELTPIVLNQLQNTKKHKVGMNNDKQTNPTNKSKIRAERKEEQRINFMLRMSWKGSEGMKTKSPGNIFYEKEICFENLLPSLFLPG